MVCRWYGYHQIVNYQPQSIHMYRQTDCLSIAMNYYHDQQPFHKPAIHNQIADNGQSGMVAGEFPLLYYVVAQGWHLIGYHIWVYRALNSLILLFGLLALFNLLFRILKDAVWSAIITLLVFASPVIAFYGCNFLTNTTSLGLVFIASNLSYQFAYKKKYVYFIGGVICFTLAGLMKVSSLIPWVVWIFIWLVSYLKPFRLRLVGHFPKGIWMTIGFLFTAGSIFGWYYYVSQYNLIHGAAYTPNNIVPLWKESPLETQKIWRDFTHFLIFQSYNRISLGILMLINLFNWILAFVFFKKNPLVYFALCLVTLGCILQVIFWFHFFGNHDYYLIEFTHFWIAIILTFLLCIHSIFPKLYKSYILKIIFSIFIVCNLYYAKLNLDFRYSHQAADIHHPRFPMTQFEAGWWEWQQQVHHQLELPLFHLASLLDKCGVEKNDRILCLPDESSNVSLVMANRKGYNEFWQSLRNSELIEYAKSKNVKYLIILSEDKLQEPSIQPYLKNELGSSGPIKIYKL